MLKDDELALLEGSKWIDKELIKDKKMQRKLYNGLVKNVPNFGSSFTFKDYLEALVTVSSRTFGHEDSDGV